MTQNQIFIQQQQALFMFLVHYIELSLIGLFGGVISYILDYYIRVFKQHDNLKFESHILLLNGILGGFASFTILALFPSDNLKHLVGFAALAGLASVPILTAMKAVSVDFIIDKIFHIKPPTQETSEQDVSQNKNADPPK